MLSSEALKSFKKIWKEEYGTDISDQEATELGVNLLTYFDRIYRPAKKEWLERLIKSNKNL